MNIFSICFAVVLLSGPAPRGLNGCVDQIDAEHVVLVQEDETVVVVDLAGAGPPDEGWVEGACLRAGTVDEALTRSHRAFVERLIRELSAPGSAPHDQEILYTPPGVYH